MFKILIDMYICVCVRICTCNEVKIFDINIKRVIK